MSILEKKVQARSSTPQVYNILPDCCSGMYTQIAAFLEKNLNCEIVQNQNKQSVVFQNMNNFEALKEGITGLLFALDTGSANAEKPECQVIVEVSPHLVRSIISAKLGPCDDTATTFTMFDVLIVQSLAELVLQQVHIIHGSARPGKIMERSLTMDTFNTVKFAKQENWIKLDFQMYIKDNLQSKAKAKKKEASKNNDVLSLTLYMAHPVADNILQAYEEKSGASFIDLDSPWAAHMRRTMLTARRPLEIVIEDLKLSIADCTRLELGQVIALPGASHERLNIKTNSNDDKIILTTATLGTYKSNKAVKLNEDLDPDFFASAILGA